MQITPRVRKIAIFGLLGLVLLYVGADVIWPYLEKVGQLHQELEQKREILARYKGRVAARELYETRIAELRGRLDSFNPKFMDTEDPAKGSADLLAILSNIAGDAGLVTSRRETRNAKRLNADYQKIGAKIDASCSPEQLVLFLAALRNQGKYLYIDDFSLRSSNVRNNFQMMPSLEVSAIIKSPETTGEGSAQRNQPPSMP